MKRDKIKRINKIELVESLPEKFIYETKKKYMDTPQRGKSRGDLLYDCVGITNLCVY